MNQLTEEDLLLGKRRNKKHNNEASGRPSSVDQYLRERGREVVFLLLVAFAIYISIALATYHAKDPSWSYAVSSATVRNAAGVVGAWSSDILLYCFGYVAYGIPILFFSVGWKIYQGRHQDVERSGIVTSIRSVGFLVAVLAAAGLVAIHYQGSPMTPYHPGGVLGVSVSSKLLEWFGVIGGTCLLVMSLFVGLVMHSGFSFFHSLDRIGFYSSIFLNKALSTIRSIPVKEWILTLRAWNCERRLQAAERKAMKQLEGADRKKREPSLSVSESKAVEPVITTPPVPRTQQESVPDDVSNSESRSESPLITKHVVKNAPVSAKEIPGEIVEHAQVNMKVLPTYSLLLKAKPVVADNRSESVLQEQAVEVEQRLADFGISAKVTAIRPGPVVTRYEIELAAGTKVSKVSNLSKDLARSLSVMSVRVVEVIPGKSVIGLELPNPNRQTVVLREVLENNTYESAASKLSIALGKDIAGHPVVVDLAKMPHLLVAGTTGSGKSVSLNVMLLSLLYKSTPEQMRLILIDPKMLELAVYEGIPHLLTPVVTDMRDAAKALRWCVAEMERRYHLMASLGVRNLAGFNAKVLDARKRGKPILDPLMDGRNGPAVELEPLPQIVVLADEFADMMVVVGKKVETLIARLAQKARAAGIHLILATQRPSVDVITGLIKANIPTRIAFQVSSKIDSRTILDQQGAEQLLGHGDMLYLPPGIAVPIRVHGAYVSDDEVHQVVDYLRSKSCPNYCDEILSEGPAENAANANPGQGDWLESIDTENGEKDELYDQAVEMVIQSRRVSISSIQRRFKIGYNRAARIVEAMEEAGVVSAMESNGSRDVLVPKRD